MGRRFEQAHHEAAHCVAAIAQGLCVRWVTLAPVDNHAAGTLVERAIFSAADNPDAQIEALKIDITVALAGACAQMKNSIGTTSPTKVTPCPNSRSPSPLRRMRPVSRTDSGNRALPRIRTCALMSAAARRGLRRTFRALRRNVRECPIAPLHGPYSTPFENHSA